jgi:hypothetical protein
MVPLILSMVVVRFWRRVAISAMVGSAIGAVDDLGDSGGVGELGDGSDEDRLERDTRLSRASVPKVAAPRLRSS